MTNQPSLLFRILSYTQLYRTERTLEVTVPSQYITFSLYFARINKDRSITSAVLGVLVLIFRHSCTEFVWIVCPAFLHFVPR